MKTNLLVYSFTIFGIVSSNFSEHITYSKTQYFPNGRINYTGCLQNGNKIGTWISFYENGNLKAIDHFSGLYNDDWSYSIGVSLEYHDNGILKRRTEFYNPDYPDSNFNFVGNFPGISSYYDIELPNGMIYTGDVWDSAGNMLVKSDKMIIKKEIYFIPIKYLKNNMFLSDTLKFKKNQTGWLEYISN